MAELIGPRIVGLVRRLDANLPTWWKTPPHPTDTRPAHWHLLQQFWREGNNHVWEAACGYTWKDEFLSGRSPDFRHQIKTKNIRCDKCSTLSKKVTS